MTNENFNYKGFTIKVITHELFPGHSPSEIDIGWHASSVVISPGTESKHHYYEKSLHPARISVTSERATDYGMKFAMRVIDEKILYANLSKFLEARPI